MREFLVIEPSWTHSVWAPDGVRPIGYIERGIAERLLGREIGVKKCDWFTREESELMRASPYWHDELPP